MNSDSMLHQLVFDSPNFKKVIHLQKPYYSIGRHLNNSIVIPSLNLSRIHALVIKKSSNGQDSFYLIDGDGKGRRSKNGIWVNGQRQLEYELKHGDIILLGQEVRVSYQIVQSHRSSYYEDESDDEASESVIVKASKEQAKSTYIGSEISQSSKANMHNSESLNLASLVELSPNPILEMDGFGNIRYMNSAATKKFRDLHKLKLEHPILKGILNTPQHKNGNVLIREIQLDNYYYEQYIHYLSERQVIRTYIFDVTQRKKAETELKYKAFFDPLTGLPNRYLFNDKLFFAIAKAKRNKSEIAVFFLDLDGFKKINDTLGHKTGDEVLRHFAKRLKSHLRKGDLISRWGGDEFTILLSSFGSSMELELLAKRILECLKAPFDIGEHQLYIKSSIGIAVYPRDGQDPETLLKHADSALYRSKEKGRNNYQFYTPMFTTNSSEKLQLENWLHEALEKDEFLLYYQPQINVKTGEIYGMEALVRWLHPKIGLVPPNKFISLAEQTGLITSIGEWVLKTACQQNRAWQKAGFPPFRIGVNLSAQQIQQPNLIEVVMDTLQDTELAPHWLELEITESTLMQNVTLASRTLQELQQMGIHVSMDDFGTGYSSLGYLKQFPFQSLKIDQTFVKDLKQNNPQDITIISAVIALGRGFNLRIIAEGVETEEQLDLLKQLQCEIMQGYWFSKPLPAEEVIKFISRMTDLTGCNEPQSNSSLILTN